MTRQPRDDKRDEADERATTAVVADCPLRQGLGRRRARGHRGYGARVPWGPGSAVRAGESWLTAAIPMENPCCSCKLTRIHPGVRRHQGSGRSGGPARRQEGVRERGGRGGGGGGGGVYQLIHRVSWDLLGLARVSSTCGRSASDQASDGYC